MAKDHGVPVTTLQNRLNGTWSAKEKLKMSMVVPVEAEGLVAKWIEREQDHGSPPNRHDILAKGAECASHQGYTIPPRESWVPAFKKRNKDTYAKLMTLQVKIPQLELWYDTLPSLVGDVPDQCLWTMGKIRLTDHLCTWTHMVECISASGDRCPPFALFSGGKDDTREVPGCEDWSAHVDKYILSCAQSDITTPEELALKWLTDSFDVFTRSLMLERRVLIVGYEFTSTRFEQACRERRIELHTLPPQSAFVAQPLQVHVFGPLKTRFQKLMAKKGPAEHPQKRKQLLEVYSKARREILNAETCKLAFKMAGIRPVSREYAFKSELLGPALNLHRIKKLLADAKNVGLENIESSDDDETTPPPAPQNADPEKFPDFEEFPGSSMRGKLGEIWIKGQTTDDARCKEI
ncbi:DDE-domain-containing protein [Yarrowia sp. B02]|nr:DDE-domain-containing protein [Yarrowia sp. B02]